VVSACASSIALMRTADAHHGGVSLALLLAASSLLLLAWL
jgi:hypothetical protein